MKEQVLRPSDIMDIVVVRLAYADYLCVNHEMSRLNRAKRNADRHFPSTGSVVVVSAHDDLCC